MRVEFLLAADEVGPGNWGIMVEPEAPVRLAPRRRDGVGRRPLVDRRQATPEQNLAAQVELFGRLVAGIDMARSAQPLEFALVKGEAFRLTIDRVGMKPEPGEVVADRLVMLGGRALGIGVVDTQEEAPAVLQRKQIIVQRGADVADMKPA